ncbi:xanthine dehydrogenase/oxidase-like [Leptidea sinapis]|uniref:xanthine dehydrogenase/oxidase-like n=1 Tax=Leptidea sinapis TaxID=189913 RepID=UPI0021C47CBD|nr:xanthine dehydrogenase/oxidase-like [Leptidea sinapis]
MKSITFSTEKDELQRKRKVGCEVDSDYTLNDFIRKHLNLRGTKYMCNEGGCGVCIVSVTAPDSNGTVRTFSVNSCLVLILSCQGWEITTVEGIGDRKVYHPIQRRLAEHNGTQCGYCTPGWVMSMYSLLKSNDNMTMEEIENSFGSNLCRCTGYRPILDAFNTFAKDAPKRNKTIDIEDLGKCKIECNRACNDWCVIEDNKVKSIILKDNKVWYRAYEISQIFKLLDIEGTESYMLVNGNTGRGAIPILEFPRDFSYLLKLYEHLDLVAHIPVRNIGSIGGNLMLKHKDPRFASDVFLLLECIGAIVTIVSKNKTEEISPVDFLSLDMTGKIITKIKIPPLSHKYKFVSFKVMPRSQNAVAQVHAAFLYRLDENSAVESARIVYGGLSGNFFHASHTEMFLAGKILFTNETLQGALRILNEEIIVEEIEGMLSPEYRKKAALGLFYKGLLNIIPVGLLNHRYTSGAIDLRKTRPLSSGSEVYNTNPLLWPMNEPMPKLEALVQCAGEANYVNDLQTQPKEVFCAFVTAKICTGEIEHIDPSPALKIPGVLTFLTAKDIPGKNSFVSTKVPTYTNEKILSDGKINFFDEPIGIIVAETEALANRASLMVKVTYKNDSKKPLLKIEDVRVFDPSRVSVVSSFPAIKEPGTDVHRVIKNTENISWQYHFSMETQSCVTRPSVDGIDVFPASQFPDMVHLGVSESLNIDQSRINVEIPRCGGAYGCKISRSGLVATASALVTYLLNRPCRFVMSIRSNLRVVGKRLPNTLEYEVAVSKSGEIQYMKYDLYGDVGWFENESVAFLKVAGVRNCYDNGRWGFNIYKVTTDTPSNVFARSPGSLETITMTEHIMERISYEINMDPLQVRLNNLNSDYKDVKDAVDILLQDSDYSNRKTEVENFNSSNRWKKRGLRLAIMSWPAANLIDYQIYISIYHGDGTVVVKQGGVECGQGINTKVIQVVAFTLGIPISKVKVKSVDVASLPNSYTTAGSRTTQAVCFGAIKCCQMLLDRLAPIRNNLDNATWERLVQEAYVQGVNLQSNYHVTSNDQKTYRCAGAATCEVELDILTGESHVRRVDLVQDVGVSVNPEIDVGQSEGAFVMGLGYWTSEHMIYDKDSGELLTDRTWTYHIPIAKDIPIDFRVKLLRTYNSKGTLGARAIAEPGICLAVSVAFALKEAIISSRNETGYPMNQWFNVDGPYTIEANVLHSDVKLEEFLFH